MDLDESARCISITWVLLIIVCQSMCESLHVGVGPSQQLVPALSAAYNSHRILFLTCLGTMVVTLLGCLGCLCCCCWRLTRRKTKSLDAYAPRSQSIVWPAMPNPTARVLEVTFLHTPGAVDCLCRACTQARKEEDVASATEC